MTVIRDDVDATRIVGVAFASAFFVAAFILFVQAWYYSMQQEDDARKVGKPASLTAYEQEQAKKLTSIDAAKKSVVGQLGGAQAAD